MAKGGACINLTPPVVRPAHHDPGRSEVCPNSLARRSRTVPPGEPVTNLVLHVERREPPELRYLSNALLTLAQQLLEAEDNAKRRQG